MKFKEFLGALPGILLLGGMDAGVRSCSKSMYKSSNTSSSYSYSPPANTYTPSSNKFSDADYSARVNFSEDIDYRKSEIPLKQKEIEFPDGDFLNKAEHDFFILSKTEWAHKHAMPHHLFPHSEFYDSPKGLEYYSEVTKSPLLINIFPTNVKTYSEMFPSSEITTNIKNELKKFSRRIKGTDGVTSIDEGDSSILNQISNSPGRLVVVFGHSIERGLKIRLPGGDSIEASSIHASCADAGKLCIILTCHGEDVGISGIISPFEALDIWEYALKEGELNNITNRDFLLAMREKRQTAVYRKDMLITVSVVVSGGGTGAVIVYYHIGEK